MLKEHEREYVENPLSVFPLDVAIKRKPDDILCWVDGDEVSVGIIRKVSPKRYLVWVFEMYPELVIALHREGAEDSGIHLGSWGAMWDEDEPAEVIDEHFYWGNVSEYLDIWDEDEVWRSLKCRPSSEIPPRLSIHAGNYWRVGGRKSNYLPKWGTSINKPSSANPPQGYVWWLTFYDQSKEDGIHIYYPRPASESIEVITSKGEKIPWQHGRPGLAMHLLDILYLPRQRNAHP